MDVYKYAAQRGLRFPSKRGELTAEQLFHLPLKTTTPNGVDLDSVARAVNDQLKAVTAGSFVEDTSADPRKTDLQAAMDLVLDVIKTKQEENRDRADAARRAAERTKILDIIATKKDQALLAAPIEDLEKKLAELSQPPK